MRFLTINDSYTLVFGCCRFTGSTTKADPETVSFSPLIAAPVSSLKQKIAARQEATDAIADAQGVVAYRERLLKELVLAVSRKAFAHFASRTAPGYLKILPRAGSDILALPQADRRKALLAMSDALAEKGLPADLAQLGKDLTVAQKNRDTAEAGVVTAELTASKARGVESEARDCVLVAYRTLHAQLTLKFPNDKARVESYFRSPTVKKAAKVAAAVA